MVKKCDNHKFAKNINYALRWATFVYFSAEIDSILVRRLINMTYLDTIWGFFCLKNISNGSNFKLVISVLVYLIVNLCLV